MLRETLQTIADVHSTVEKQAGVGNVWSLETLRRWLAEKAGSSDVATLKEYVSVIPEYLVRRFISADQDAVVVSGRVPDLDSSQILPVVEKLDHALDTVRKAHPGYEIAVTGLSAIAARNSAKHDREAQSWADDRVRAGRDLHRTGVPLGGRDVLVHPAGHFPGGIVGHGAVVAGGGAAVRKRRGAYRVLRPGTECDNSLPQSAEARGDAGRQFGTGGRACDRAGRPGADPDHGGAGLRSRW